MARVEHDAALEPLRPQRSDEVAERRLDRPPGNGHLDVGVQQCAAARPHPHPAVVVLDLGVREEEAEEPVRLVVAAVVAVGTVVPRPPGSGCAAPGRAGRSPATSAGRPCRGPARSASRRPAPRSPRGPSRRRPPRRRPRRPPSFGRRGFSTANAALASPESVARSVRVASPSANVLIVNENKAINQAERRIGLPPSSCTLHQTSRGPEKFALVAPDRSPGRYTGQRVVVRMNGQRCSDARRRGEWPPLSWPDHLEGGQRVGWQLSRVPPSTLSPPSRTPGPEQPRVVLPSSQATMGPCWARMARID
jgi:hypothetical protein